MAEYLIPGDRVCYIGDAFKHGVTAIISGDEGTVVEYANVGLPFIRKTATAVMFDGLEFAGAAFVPNTELEFLAPKGH